MIHQYAKNEGALLLRGGPVSSVLQSLHPIGDARHHCAPAMNYF